MISCCDYHISVPHPQVVIYANIKGPLSASVWASPQSGGSAFEFTGEETAGVPACMTAAAPITTHAAPFVVSTRYPGTQALSVSTLGRTAPRPVGYHNPFVNVTQNTLMGLGDVRDGALPTIGVFGTFGRLTLVFEKGTVARIDSVHAQDMRGDASVEVTKLVNVDRVLDQISLSGTLIAVAG